jgi:hypothetical protein
MPFDLDSNLGAQFFINCYRHIVVGIWTFFKKHFKLISGLAVTAALVWIAVFYSFYSIWHIDSNSSFLEKKLIYQDGQSFPDKVSQLAKATQTLKEAEAELQNSCNDWQIASNRYYAVKQIYDELANPVKIKMEVALREMQQEPEVFAARFYPEQLAKQQKEIDDAKQQINRLESSIIFNSKNTSSIEQDLATMTDSQINQLLITELKYTKADVEDGRLANIFRKQGKDKIRYNEADESRYKSELVRLHAALDQAPLLLVSNLATQISRPFEAQIEDIARQTGIEKMGL